MNAIQNLLAHKTLKEIKVLLTAKGNPEIETTDFRYHFSPRDKEIWVFSAKTDAAWRREPESDFDPDSVMRIVEDELIEEEI